jgi:hypothetical protein
LKFKKYSIRLGILLLWCSWFSSVLLFHNRYIYAILA